MRSRRVLLGAALLPLALLTLRDAPPRPARPEPGGPRRPHTAPQPVIVSRAAWGADEHMVREQATYTGPVSVVFIHHTGHPNDYDCADVPALLRDLEADHVLHQGWDDIGYNFLVDKCGTIYEGRAGGISRAVHGAHTQGFNHNSVGIAAVGDFRSGQEVPRALLEGIAKVAAWKLRPGADPHGTVRLVSTNDKSKYKKGEVATFHVIAGHRDTHETDCPGEMLYAKLPALRDAVARLRKP